MTAILGISGLYHDAAAAVVVDGEIRAAAQEERFTRIKHDWRFPKQAIDYCLFEAGLEDREIDFVAFYDKPLLKFDRLTETWLDAAPLGFPLFAHTVPAWLQQRLHVGRSIRKHLGHRYRRQPIYLQHHQSHAASAYFPSPFSQAAILTLDGVGEWATTTWGVGEGNRIEIKQELRFPHSIGLLYSAFTAYCGFRVNDGEYKLMGLAPLGEPKYVDAILDHLIDLKADGSFRLDMSYFSFCHQVRMTSEKFHRLFGNPPRQPRAEITQHHKDLAASIQAVVEEIVLRLARTIHQTTEESHLCMEGGVALNCVANGRLAREGPFEKIWIQPAAGDAGGALGAALFVWHQLLGNDRQEAATDHQRGSLLGPAFSDDQMRAALDSHGANYQHHPSDEALTWHVAGLLNEGNCVGWMQGRMEFGPRALGSRSILADPRDEKMQRTLNHKIKFRESFRPFAPAVLAEDAGQHFDVTTNTESPYMLLTVPVAECHRSSLPAVTHVDDSARVQTVDRQRNELFHQLLSHFKALTGVGVIVNTSFNVRDEPIVCTPADAWRCFMASGLDVLAMGRFVLLKDEQTTTAAGQGGQNFAVPSHNRVGEPSLPIAALHTQPSRFTLGIFGMLLSSVLALLSWNLWSQFSIDNATSIPAIVTGFAVVAAGVIVSCFRPRWLHWPYRALMLLTFPLRYLLSMAALGCVYFLVLTPTALLFRICGRTSLERQREQGRESYFSESQPPPQKSSYFRQF